MLVSMKVYLGDAVMAAPSLDALEAAGWNVTLLTAPLAAEALGRPSVVPYEKGRWPWKTLAQAHRLREMGFDACVLVNRSVRAALLAKLAGIPIRIGHPVEGRGSLLTHRVAYDPFALRGDLYRRADPPPPGRGGEPHSSRVAHGRGAARGRRAARRRGPRDPTRSALRPQAAAASRPHRRRPRVAGRRTPHRHGGRAGRAYGDGRPDRGTRRAGGGTSWDGAGSARRWPCWRAHRSRSVRTRA